MSEIVSGTQGEVARYIANGLVATLVHYCVLEANMSLLDMRSAGVANGVAAVFGIAVSFLGSRYFVFPGRTDGALMQLSRFLPVYAILALMHMLFLRAWSDHFGFDYRVGFLIATALQVAVSFLANKLLVFR
nr:GtrA family protein [Lysobacter oculi]